MCKGMQTREGIHPLKPTCPSLLLGAVTPGVHGPRACLFQNSGGTLSGSSPELPSLNIGRGIHIEGQVAKWGWLRAAGPLEVCKSQEGLQGPLRLCDPSLNK